jgi:hypothetical protein
MSSGELPFLHVIKDSRDESGVEETGKFRRMSVAVQWAVKSSRPSILI